MRQLPVLGEPLLPAAIEDFGVLVAVVLQLPEGPGGKPVVVVAIEDDRRVVVDAGLLQKVFKVLLGRKVPRLGISQLCFPVPADGARDVAVVVGRRIHVDLDEAYIVVVKVIGRPVGRDQNVRIRVVTHRLSSVFL